MEFQKKVPFHSFPLALRMSPLESGKLRSQPTMAVPIETVSAVGALILSSLSLEVISHSPQELITECVSWCFIFICGKLYLLLLKKQSRPFNSRPFNSAEISTITFGATLLSLTCSVEKITWSLVRPAKDAQNLPSF
jgi:hypothetical protein